MTVAVPYSWLKQVPATFNKSEDTPIFGYHPLFPWKELADALGRALQVSDFTLQPGAKELLFAGHLLQGLGDRPKVLAFDVAPLEGVLWFALAESELQRLLSTFLTKEAESTDIIDPQYRQGIVHFLAYEVFNQLRGLDFGKEFTFHLLEAKPLPDAQDLYAQDVTFAFEGNIPFAARLFFSEEFRRSWKMRFAERSLTAQVPISLAEKLSLVLHVEAGRTHINTQEWDQVAPGDFLLLAQSTIDPSKEKGRVMLTLGGRPLYRARIKDGNLKILEFPLYQEVEATMAIKKQGDENQEFNGNDEGYDAGFEHGEDDYSYDPTAEQTLEHSLHDASDSEHSMHDAPTTGSMVEGMADADEPLAPAKPEPVNVGNLPVTIVIEVGRVQISVRKLLEMQPGDLLELNLDPDNGVDLVANGTIIGKGELLKVGETLGVRLLDKV